MTAAELCRAIEIDKAAISRVLRELDAGGLIRYPDGRRYRARVELTDAGNRVAIAVAGRIEAIVERIGRGLTDAEREIFYNALVNISRNLEELINGEENP